MERTLSMVDEEVCGFDESFLSVVPDNLRCSACHLVLRKPIQFMKCGHRICQPCLDRLKTFSEKYNTVPTCPVDKEMIDLFKVFDDTVIDKAIGNLLVSCKNKTCTWTGYLRDLEFVQSDVSLFEVYERLLKCEYLVVEKEKEVLILKKKLEDFERVATEKEEEQQSFRINIERKIQEMHEVQTDMKERLEKEVEFVKLKNQVLENEVKSLKEELVETKHEMNENKVNLKSEIEDVGKMNFKSQESIIVDLNKLKEKVVTNSSLLWTQLDSENNEPYNLQFEVEKAKKEIHNISDNMRNVENIIYRWDYKVKNDMSLKWILSDYCYHQSVGIKVFSPVFYTQLQGYRFQLHVSWSGEEKDVLGVFLHLHRGTSHQEVMSEPFRMQYTFEVVNRQGEKHCVTIPLSAIDSNREDCFEIAKNQSKSYSGCGCKAFLRMPFLQHFISNDTMAIYCRFQSAQE